MKVLYVLPYLSTGGTEKHVLDLVTGFSGVAELFLLAPPGEILKRFQEKQLTYFPFPRLDQSPISGLRQFFKALKKIVAQNKIDLIHVHGAPELIFLLRRVVKDIPVVFTVHGFVGSFKSWNYWLCARLCNHYAERVIVVAEAEKKLLREKGISPDLISTIHNGIPDPRKDTITKPAIMDSLPGEKIVIGTIARLEPAKGINFLITAFAGLLKTKLPLHLVVVGTGSKEAELKEQVQRLGIENDVTFTGYRTDVHNFLFHFDIFVIPSLHEAHPLVLMEGMAQAKPLIATSVGGIPEVIVDGENGFLIPPGDSEEITGALKRIIADQQLQKILGQNARKTYEEGFTVERMLAETRAVYQSILRI